MTRFVANSLAPSLAIIGGSGLTQMPELECVQRLRPETPYGVVSDEILLAHYKGHAIAFLPRHGAGHVIPPHKINYRANIWALAALGVRQIIAVNTVGGISADLTPGMLVVPDQLIDYTHGREQSFERLVNGKVEHIDFTRPYAESVRSVLLTALLEGQLPYRTGGTYGCMQGPRLETAAEIRRLKNDGCDMVGMTGMPEAALARELGVDYAALCLVVNPAAGLGSETIRMEDIDRVMQDGMTTVKSAIFLAVHLSLMGSL